MARRPLLLLPLLAPAACQTGAQDYEPGWDEFHVTRFDSELELSARYRDETRSAAGVSDGLTELEFREDYRIFLGGFYYHPKLMEYDADLSVGLEQRDVAYDGAEDRDIDGTNTEYRFDVELLQDEAYGLDLFGSRREVITRQNFFETNEALTETQGFALHAREWWIPSTLTFRDYEFRGRRGYEYFEDSSSWRLEGQRSGDEASFRYDAEIVDFEQYALGESVQDRRASATYRRTGGELGRNVFRSFLSASDQDGAAGYTRLLLDNSYRHHWTRRFSGNLGLNLTRTERDSANVDALTFGGGLQHQLFGSLTSSLGSNWTRSLYDDGTADSWFSRGALTYSKKLPFGSMRASQGLSVRFDDRDALGSEIAVVAEPHVFTLGVPLFLDSPNVDIDSVVVRDITGLITYTQGADYFLVQVGAQVRIDIPVSSLISPGDTILVDYDFLPSPARRARIVGSQSSAGMRVGEAIDFNVSYQTTDSTVLSGTDDGTLDDSRRFNALLQTYPAEDLVVGAEYEDFVSQQSPFIRYRAFAAWSHSVGPRSDLTSSADMYWLDQVGIGEESGTTARVTLNSRIGLAANGSLSAQYRRNDLITDDAEGYLLEAAYRQRIGESTVRASVQWVEEDFRVGVDQQVLRLELVFTRRF